jgi:uracil-DNA glycosylase
LSRDVGRQDETVREPRREPQELLLEIARCPVIERCITDYEYESPCRSIIRHQWPGFSPVELRARWRREHHVPVPWVGHLEEAPLLFLSSNPGLGSKRDPGKPAGAPHPPLAALRSAVLAEHASLGRPFEAPKWEWADEQILDSYESSFDVWLDGGTRPLQDEQGTPGTEVPYWAGVKAVAADVFGENVVPGRQYALTEVVRCKSSGEFGVPAAASECVPRYLKQTLAVSPAPVIVILGRKARQVFRALYKYADAPVVSPREIAVEGRPRRIVFLSHPSAREGGNAKPLKYPKRLDAADLEIVKHTVAQARP